MSGDPKYLVGELVEVGTPEGSDQPRALIHCTQHDIAAVRRLPVSSAEALLETWDWMASHWRELGEKRKQRGELSSAVDACESRGSVFALCASQLRRELARATERQPEENKKHQPTPASGGTTP